MKPTLQLNIGQSLTLTPQLQQAIRMLQLSTLDLQQEIQQAVESNPLLEAAQQEEKTSTSNENNTIDEFQDFQWSQLYNTSHKSPSFNDSEFTYENQTTYTRNLRDHLLWQLELTPISDIDSLIARAIIDAVNDDGFLTQTISELHQSLKSSDYELDVDEVEMVRHRILRFDPAGCGALNLAETLIIQLQQLPKNNESVQLAEKLLEHDLGLLGQHNYKLLMKNHGIDETSLDKALQIIQRLNPKPGSIIGQNTTEYIIPDLVVKKKNDLWQVVLNDSCLPRLSINKFYAAMIQRANNSVDNQFLKNNLQEARWFLKSIQSRQDTLLKVGKCIVDYQKDFFEFGDEAMKPLILNDVAQALDMHESTISRVTTQKFIHTPRGVFELKYFFSSHVATDKGGECSSTAIRALIKKLIATENRKKPLSDNKIAQLIGEQGIQVARRTVAKYREALGIASSSERKVICI